MGVRVRKSINLGGGFRINLSKSGVGYSWGIKGARITKTARGNTRTTFSIPGSGISHINEVRKEERNDEFNNLENIDLYEGAMQIQSTENIDIADYQPAEYKELLDSIKRIQNINLLSTILICTFILAVSPIFILTGIAGLALKIYVHIKLPITMEYEFDEEAKNSYNNLCEIWMSLNENNKYWQTISESQLNEKLSGGASRGVDRISSNAITKMPYFIKSNVKPFGLKLRKQKLFFLPDKLLFISGRKVGALNYSDIRMRLETTNFVETDSVPEDAHVLGYTWLKVNKNGSPDRRFKENRQVPVCEYGRVLINSEDSLQVELMCSNSETIKKMKSFALKVFTS
ncbi:DUF4236 domain-containing protein [Listeria immobilis]|uniref:DUF4236 domain-containing protein n=1 Tax=Listeria immobilis TaxID=2713502 RepID=UPI0016273102|nr:DUF4236 domain-containing protein [Listeria immobilis]MBC1514688.1 DUF4236 domain-containing protein [Listeria immobilis]